MLGSAYGKVVIDSSGVKSGVDGANKSLKGLESNTKSLSGGLAKSWGQVGLAIGAVTLAVTTMKKAIDFAQEGAQVKQMGESFDTMLSSMGAAPDLLQQLQDASMGTVDNMSLMASTSMMLAGTQGELGDALAKAAPELLEMANVAQKLNPTLGDTTFLYDSLARGIKRGSPLILDNLGILVKVEDANKKYAESIGKATNELTAEEQKIALLNAVLEQKEILMQQAGGSADSMTDSYERLNAEIKNQTDDMKALLDDALRPVADVLYKIISVESRREQTLGKLSNSLVESAGSYKEYAAAMVEAYIAEHKLDVITAGAMRNRIKEGRQVDEMMVAYDGLTEAEFNVMRMQEELTDYTDGHTKPAFQEAEWAVKGYSVEMLTAEQAAADLRTEQERLKDELQDLQLLISGPISEEYGSFIEKQGELTEKTEELKGKIAELEGLEYLTPEQQEELTGLRTELGKNNEAIQENVNAHDRATKEIVFDLLTQRAAMDELTNNEMLLLNEVALRWGLVDQATYETTQGIGQALTDLENGRPFDWVINDLTNIMITAKTAGDTTNTEFNKLATGDGFVETIRALETMNGLANGLTGTRTLRFQVDVSGDPIPTAAGWVQPMPNATGVEDFVVPAGYPNDSFLVGLTSGERLNVERPGVAALNDRTSGGISVSVEVNAAVASEVDIYRLADQVADVVVQKIQRANL